MADENEIEDALKIGARNSRADATRIQAAHDTLADLGAECRTGNRSSFRSIEANDDTLTIDGYEVKATQIPEGVKLSGYLVRFSTAADPDISAERDFFTKDTDFDVPTWPTRASVYFNHGMDRKLRKRKLGDATLTTDEVGVWAETILTERDEYEKAIIDMAKAGKLGWSSGTAPHLVERQAEGKSNWIKRWPLGLDASLTHTPAEPRNQVIPLKSLGVDQEPEETTESEPEAATTAESDGATKATTILGGMEMEISQEQLETIVSAAVSQGVDKALKSLPPVEVKAGVEIVKDEADQEFATPGEFYKAVKTAAYYGGREDPRLRSMKVTADGTKATGMSEGIPADGGYLIPPGQASGIVEKMLSTGGILSRISSDPIAGNTMTYNGVDETTHVGSLYGGIVPYWLAEGGTITASKPKFYQVELKLKKIGALCYATDEQLEDTTALASWIGRSVPNALRFYVEDAIIEGDGTGKPLGIMNSPALVTTLRVTHTTFVLADVLEMYSRRWTGVNDYVWLVNPTLTPLLNAMTAATAPVYLPPGGLSASPYGQLMGFPVIETEYLKTAYDTGDILLVSLSQYQAITKSSGIQSASSIHVSFATAETAFRFVYRIDGAPLWHSALTPLHGSTVSPFVTCSSASS